ncbi:helix-turn-helix domain-containing protein [Chryseobacterium sp. SL1]|uniref:helix-turn-helix domain-containing protein n=1 Tax=Chryseobacterium sp. SL1 TaxID=2995159 RepID=UPI0022766181|nr:helix-turn-helix domain-containing protein [Chryseobacterium sp. SL1]MCY1663498.1 helix-turn-helix domain-containing protein [Chryseobacterium sp. SL1]
MILKLCIDTYYLATDILYRVLGEERSLVLLAENFLSVVISFTLIKKINVLYKINFRYLVNATSFLLCVYIFCISYQTHPKFPVAYFYFVSIPVGLLLVNSLKISLLYSFVLLTLAFVGFYLGDFNSFPLYTVRTKNLITIEFVRMINYYLPVLFTLFFLFFDIYYLIECNKYALEIDHKEEIKKITQQRIIQKDNLDILFDEILKSLELTQSYRNTNYSIVDLAKDVNSNRTYVSNALSKSNTNFYDLINEFRIKYVLENMRQNVHKRYSIKYLYQKAGFNHQTTFNKAFKKETGSSPSEFIKNNVD